MNRENIWQIINKSTKRVESKWIEEEENLLNWAENPNFEKQPLKQIAIKCIYVSSDILDTKIGHIGEGILQTSIKLEPQEHFSILHKSEFFNKINEAKTPKMLFGNDVCENNKWLEKSYTFDNAAIYSIPIDHEQINQFDPNVPFTQLNFSKDIAKIHCSLSVFHDLYEIIVIMREVNTVLGLKSIIKDTTKMGKTKKVRISDDSPKEYLFSKTRPVSGKRRTKKAHQ
jgi:hypothetical protein